jgi:hypothetical protein
MTWRRWPMYSLDAQLARLSGNNYDAREAETAIVSQIPDWIARIEQTADPGEAFGELVALTIVLNAAVGVRPSIVEKIKEHIDKVRKALATIAEQLDAGSFAIGASVTGLSVSLTFPVK